MVNMILAFICAFAILGIYSAALVIYCTFSRKCYCVAIDIVGKSLEEIESDMKRAENLFDTNRHLSIPPVLLTDTEPSAELASFARERRLIIYIRGEGTHED